MRRREFVASALALPLSAPLGALIRGTPSAAPDIAFGIAAMRFGCAAITWNGNDSAAIDDIAALGFRGIQLRSGSMERWRSEPQALREILSVRGLHFVALSSGNVGLDPLQEEQERDTHLRNAQFVRNAGGTFLQVIDSRPEGRAPTREDRKRMGKLLSDLGRRVADLGVTLVYHNHMGALGQSPDEVDEVLGASDPHYVRLLLDVAHYKAAGGDPVAAIRRYAGRLAFVHLKDLQCIDRSNNGQGYRFVELGRGVVDLRGVMRELKRAQFDGWGMVELDQVTEPGITPKACAQRSKDFLTSLGYSF